MTVRTGPRPAPSGVSGTWIKPGKAEHSRMDDGHGEAGRSLTPGIVSLIKMVPLDRGDSSPSVAAGADALVPITALASAALTTTRNRADSKRRRKLIAAP